MDQPTEVTLTIRWKDCAQLFTIVILGNLTSFAIIGALAKYGKNKKAEVEEETNVVEL